MPCFAFVFYFISFCACCWTDILREFVVVVVVVVTFMVAKLERERERERKGRKERERSWEWWGLGFQHKMLFQIQNRGGSYQLKR